MMTNKSFVLLCKAESYLKRNPERFNEKEKEYFRAELKKLLVSPKSYVFADEIYDFLVSEGLIQSQSREGEFANYINKKYSTQRYKKILDVGAGRMCKLSQKLAKLGYKPTALDPNIRLTDNEAKNLKIAISKRKFFCDEYSKSSKGYSIENFDLIVGLEPCDATEHIIRQAIKYDIPFEVLLCYMPHKALDGKSFNSPLDWYKYLESISNKVKIKKNNDSYIATNIEEERGL